MTESDLMTRAAQEILVHPDGVEFNVGKATVRACLGDEGLTISVTSEFLIEPRELAESIYFSGIESGIFSALAG